jgi:hypothetical protein
VWTEHQQMVEEFRQGMPEEAKDTFVWDKDAAREVKYIYTPPPGLPLQIIADNAFDIEIQSK